MIYKLKNKIKKCSNYIITVSYELLMFIWLHLLSKTNFKYIKNGYNIDLKGYYLKCVYFYMIKMLKICLFFEAHK